jgi:O-antigen ligase
VQMAGGQRWLRAYGTLSHPNTLGGFLLPGLALALERFIATRRRGWAAAGALIALGLVLTFSRSAWVAGAAMLAVGAWLGWPHWRGQIHLVNVRRWAVGGAVILALVGLPLMPILAARANLLGEAQPLERRSLSDRVQLSLAAVAMFVDRPLFGVGAGAFVVQLYQTRAVELPLEPAHNLPLLLAAELGLPGLLALGVAAAAVAWRLWRRRGPAAPAEVALGAAVVGLMTVGLFDHYWWTMPPARLLFVTVLGLWVGYWERKPASVR